MSKKYMQIEYRGYKWRFPADRIAHNYAEHYEKKHQEEYHGNFDYIMQHDDDLYEWFLNNQDWEDVEEAAVLVETPKPLTRPPINSDGCIYSVVLAH